MLTVTRFGLFPTLRKWRWNKGRPQFSRHNCPSGVRLHCRKCGITRLTVGELQKLICDKVESPCCPKCGSVASFV